MRRDPIHSLVHAVNFGSRGHVGALDHYDFDPQLSGCINFSARTAPARVLGNDQVDLELLQKRKVIFKAERPAVNDHIAVRERQVKGGIVDQPQKVRVLWIARKVMQMHAPDGQKNPFGGRIQSSRRVTDTCHINPAIPTFRDPRLSRQGNKRNTRHFATLNRVCAHLRGKGMGRIDHMGDSVVCKKTGETFSPAKSALSDGNGLWLGVFNTTRQRHQSLNTYARHALRERAGLDSSAKYQEVWPHA